MSDNVEIRAEQVIKTGEPAALRIEAEKTRRAGTIGRDSRLFEAPEVLAFDQKAGILTFARVPDIRGLRDVLRGKDGHTELMSRLGRTLATIHERLQLPADMAGPLPQPYRLDEHEVFIHGDFSLGNIFLTQDDQLVIIDWQTTSKIGPTRTYGTRYYDVMWFVYNLFYRPLGREPYRLPIAGATLAEPFLKSYFQASAGGLHSTAFTEYARQFLATQTARETRKGRSKGLLHWWPRKRQLLLAPSHWRLRRFIAAIERKNNIG